jgi:hypothetical protein
MNVPANDEIRWTRSSTTNSPSSAHLPSLPIWVGGGRCGCVRTVITSTNYEMGDLDDVTECRHADHMLKNSVRLSGFGHFDGDVLASETFLMHQKHMWT